MKVFISLLLILTACRPAEVQRNTSAEAVDSVLTRAGNMMTPRAAHTATLLPNGLVLMTGGFKKGGDESNQLYLKSAELYNPKTRTFTATGSMRDARCGHHAVLLETGNVLIVGGTTDQPLRSAELYHPDTGAFSGAGEMSVPRSGSTATRLASGDVLIAGGIASYGGALQGQASAELYKSETGKFMPVGQLQTGRSAHSATLLASGDVLIAGGISVRDTVLSSAECFDAVTQTFSVTGSLRVPRYKHAATLLPDGSVLVAGGSDRRDWQGKYKTTERYRPKPRVFTADADMSGERFKFTGAMEVLHNGTVLLGGGARGIEVFHTQTQHFTVRARLAASLFYSTVTRLSDGSALITGGYDDRIHATDTAWIFNDN